MKRRLDYHCKKLRLKNSQSRNWKNKQIINVYLNKRIMELKELIYAGAKLDCEKIGVPKKNLKRNSKTGWEIELEMQIRNQRQRTKMIRQRKNAGTCWDKKKRQHNM